MAFTSGNDINLLQASDAQTLGAGLGNDKYLLSAGSGLTAGQVITISDADGTNTLQFIGGLTIASSRVSATAIQLVLSNGATVNLNGANTFSFEIGGSPLSGVAGTIQTFSSFVTNTLRTTTPTGSAVNTGATNIAFNENGTTTATGSSASNPTAPTLTSQADALSTKNLATTAIATLSMPEVIGLKADTAWTTSKLTYSFNSKIPTGYASDPSNTSGWQPMNTAEKAAATAVFTKLAALINVTFNEVGGETGDMRFNTVSTDSDTAGFAYYPGQDIGGDIFMSLASRSTADMYVGTNYGVRTMAHEIGHAMGLKHSFETPLVPVGTDDSDYTAMSYTKVHYYNPVTTIGADKSISTSFLAAFRVDYALYDVEALQAIYGANMQTRTGNDVYSIVFADHQLVTIWDAGGTDLIDASKATGTCFVNMKDGTMSSVDTKSLAVQKAEAIALYQPQTSINLTTYFNNVYSGSASAGFYTGDNNLSIVKGAVIENLNTGLAADTVFDNSVNNIINTGAGDDKIYLGLGGFDSIDGGAGQDIVFLSATRASIKQEHSADGSYLIVGSTFAAKLVGIETVTCTDGNLQLV